MNLIKDIWNLSNDQIEEAKMGRNVVNLNITDQKNRKAPIKKSIFSKQKLFEKYE